MPYEKYMEVEMPANSKILGLREIRDLKISVKESKPQI